MRLVEKPVTKLTAEDTGTLLDLVKTAEARNEDFYKQCRKDLALYRGEHGNRQNAPEITVNLAYAHVNTVVPSLFFRDPTFKAIPATPDRADSAEAWTNFINQYIRKTEYKKYTKEVVFNGSVYAESWKKWVVVTTSSEDLLAGEGKLSKNKLETDGPINETGNSGPVSWADKQAAIGKNVSPLHVITDSKDRDPENSRFVAIKYRKLISEVANDPKYKDGWKELQSKYSQAKMAYGNNNAIKGLGTDPQERKETVGNDDEIVTIYEVWIYQLVGLKLYRQVVVLLDDFRDGPIMQPKLWQEFVGKYLHTYPIHRLVRRPCPEHFPLSELQQMWPLMKVMNWTVTRIAHTIEQLKTFYNKYPEAAKSPDKVDAQLKSGDPVVVVDCNQAGVPAIEPVVTQQVSRDLWQLVPVVQGLMQQVVATSQNQRGAAAARTATEASIIDQNIGIRQEEQVDVVAEFIKRDGEILVRILRAIVTEDQVFKLTKNTADVAWGKFTVEDAAWSPDIEVDVDSFRQAQDQEQANALLQAMQIGANMAPFVGQNIDYVQLYSAILEKIGIANPDKYMTQGVPDELQQMTEITAMIITGEYIPPQPGENHQKHIAVMEDFYSSPFAGELTPEHSQLLQQHYEETVQMLKQEQAQQSGGAGANSNQYDTQAQEGMGSPAGEAREETASVRAGAGGFA